MSHILLIDSYDSFTFNLAQQLRSAIPDSTVHVIHNDTLTPKQLLSILPYFHAVAVGPGPGSPSTPSDVGVIPHLWSLTSSSLLPVLGVCLGHQSLCMHFGGSLKRLENVKHGQASELKLANGGVDIMADVKPGSRAIRYHSLHVTIEEQTEIIPLAWAQDDDEKERVLMAARHSSKPFWGVQYHPESICTRGGGDEVVQSFWMLAQQWNSEHRPSIPAFLPADHAAKLIYSLELHPPPLTCRHSSSSSQTQLRRVQTVSLPYDISSPSVPSLVELLGLLKLQQTSLSSPTSPHPELILFDSAAQPSRFSIIGLVSPFTPRITHCVGDHFVSIRTSSGVSVEMLEGADVWEWLARYVDARKIDRNGDGQGVEDVPFWGGLMGYSNYEAGVSTLNHSITTRVKSRPDLSFAFVERSIVVDHKERLIHVQSVRLEQADWVKETSSLLQVLVDPAFTPASSPPHPSAPSLPTSNSLPSFYPQTTQPRKNSRPLITLPDKSSYLAAIVDAQEYLSAGESYELCVTGLTRVLVPPFPYPSASSDFNSSSKRSSPSFAWHLFRTLRNLNPAPYGTYLKLGSTTLVGSSPERFLSWNRSGVCEMRPIKGTVKKQRGKGQPDVTFEEASEHLLSSPKELAENLMIVDLIRHDMQRVVGPGDEDRLSRGGVQVEKLFEVEEYETVYQLVSVIRGQVDSEKGYGGWDVLAGSLPPGSMTGAPKPRSISILQSIESSHRLNHPGGERGIYSGVCGYWCIGGSGDFSVVIRSAYKYDDETDTAPGTGEVWWAGAGGAITALSDPEEEWEEMEGKLAGSVRAFNVACAEMAAQAMA